MASTPASSRRLSLEAFMALGPDPPLQRLELSDGELIVTPSATKTHNWIRDRLNTNLNTFVQAHALGEVICETDVQVGPNSVRRPDVAFLRPERVAGIDPEKLPQPPPDLVFEVVSANDRGDDLMLKVRQYLQAGAHGVWLLFPKLGIAHRYHDIATPPAIHTIEGGGALIEPEMLPGWRLPLSELFAGMSPK